MGTLISLILAIGVGFGTACLIFASLLYKSNNLGDSIGKADLYTIGIQYDTNHCYDDSQSAVYEIIPPEYYQLEAPPDDKKVEIINKNNS